VSRARKISVEMTEKQWDWVEGQCLGAALTYTGYASLGKLKSDELKKLDTVILPAMKALDRGGRT
jgi:hypothetical protein